MRRAAPARAIAAGVVLALTFAMAAAQVGAAGAQDNTKSAAPTSKSSTAAARHADSLAAARAADSLIARADSLTRKMAADSAAAAVDTLSIGQRVQRQSNQINDQAKLIETQQRTLESLNRRISELEEKQDSIPQASSLEDRLKRIESGLNTRPELPPDLVSAGNFPGSMRIPGTDAALKIGGMSWTSLISTWDPLGSVDRFLTNSIPVQGTAPPGSGPRLQFTAAPSRLNFDLRTPTSSGQLRAFIEGDFEGSGTTFKLRHAYGQYGQWLMGQTWTTFSDPEVQVEDIDFEGLNAKTLRRQALVRYTWRLDSLRIAAAAEEPSTLVSGGTSVNQVPDILVRATRRITNGTLKASVVVRQLRFQPDSLPSEVFSTFAFGVSASGNLPAPRLGKKDVLHFEINAGQGIARYINDLNSDTVGEDGVFDLPSRTLEALPVVAFFVTAEHYWIAPGPFSKHLANLRSSLILGYVNVENLDVQGPDAYHKTNRVAVNMVWSPVPMLDLGTEFIYGTRTNKDGSWGRARQLQFRGRIFF